MGSPHDLQRHGLAHTSATERLDSALHDQRRLSAETNAAHGGDDELGLRAELASANEEVTARKAWLGYLDQDG